MSVNNAVGILRKSLTIDTAVSSYCRSPTPVQQEVEAFATEVLEAEHALSSNDVSKLMALEGRVSPKAPRQADKICKLCFKLLLKEKTDAEISQELNKEIDKLLEKVPNDDERVEILSSLACLDPYDRAMAVSILWYSLEMDTSIKEPLTVIFADATGEARRKRSYTYLEQQLNSKDKPQSDHAADLIIGHRRIITTGPTDSLFIQAKERFITSDSFTILYEKYEKEAKFPKSYTQSINYQETRQEDFDRFAYLLDQAGQEQITPEATKFFVVLQHIMNLPDKAEKGRSVSPQIREFSKMLKSSLNNIADVYNNLSAQEKLPVQTKPKIEW